MIGVTRGQVWRLQTTNQLGRYESQRKLKVDIGSVFLASTGVERSEMLTDMRMREGSSKKLGECW